MRRETASVFLWILIFFTNFTFLPAILGTDENNNTLNNVETGFEINVTSEYSNNSSEEKFGLEKLEPSIDIEINSVNNEFNANTEKYSSETFAENLESLNQIIGHNESPVFVYPESFSPTEEVDKVSEIPLTVTSRNEMEQNVIVQTSDIPENTTKDTEIINGTLSKVDMEKEEITTVIADKTEEIPSFSEWAQKRLEEETEQNNSSKQITVNGKTQNAKIRWKNYASLDCGAKVIAANPESVSPGAILSPSTDEYKLNPCTSRIWFVVELCEAIQLKNMELANYELFSSSPKDFAVSISERYPTRDWSHVGKFTAQDERDIQSFDIDTDLFGKYIKVEVKSHYGSEHYCPISLFRAYGTSVFEVLQKDDPAHENRDEDDDEADDYSETSVAGHSHKNLFSSATDAVISMVKRAAEALGNKVDNQTSGLKVNHTVFTKNYCNSLRHVVVCNNCNETFFAQIYDLLSCKATYIQKLVRIPAIYKALINSFTCRSFGLDFKTDFNDDSSYIDNLHTFFPEKYVGAMCNEVALIKHQGSLNLTQQYLNITKKLTKDKIVNLDVTSSVISLMDISNETSAEPNDKMDNGTSNFNLTEPDISLAEQIKPTKALNSDTILIQTVKGSAAPDEVHEPIKLVPKPTEEVNTVIDTSAENGGNTNIPTLETVMVTESSENLEDHIDNMFSSEINGDSQGTVPQTSTTATLPQAPKESIFLRLSNRIKALEKNMSLSSQYLEELSKRYKKQVEEMQMLLEKTLVSLREESSKANERHKHFEDRLNTLSENMESLLAERQVLFSVLYMSVTIILVSFCVYFFCGKRPTSYGGTAEKRTEVLRRSSVDVLREKEQVEKKKRRPSDQVMKIVRYSSLQEDDKARKSRKRKKSKIMRSNSTSSLKIVGKTPVNKRLTDWVDENRQAIEDIPFALEESDLCILESFSSPKNSFGNDSPKTDASQNFFENVNKMAKNNGTEQAKFTPSFNSTSSKSDSSLNEPVKKEKRSFKKLLKKVF